jgi:hypothetical protein
MIYSCGLKGKEHVLFSYVKISFKWNIYIPLRSIYGC